MIPPYMIPQKRRKCKSLRAKNAQKNAERTRFFVPDSLNTATPRDEHFAQTINFW